jgi:uncharacterized protein (DUF58 family)
MAFADWVRVEASDSSGRAEVGARRIYILPTRYGLIYATLAFLMLLGAVNYGNNPAHLLTFLLAALGSNGMYQTWRNLRGLRLQCRGAQPIFAGEPARLLFDLDAGGRERPAVQLMYDGGDPVLLDLPADNPLFGQPVLLPDLPRGQHRPGRLVISTRYPLGLFRAWCYLDCDSVVLVYPRPGPSWEPPGQDQGRQAGGSRGSGNDDFAGLRNYLPGDQPSRIDWKSYARDRGLNTRLFSGEAAAPLWIRWQDAPGAGTEARLRALSRAVLGAEAAGRAYGLQTPEGTIGIGLGAGHRHECLRHLALFGEAGADGYRGA